MNNAIGLFNHTLISAIKKNKKFLLHRSEYIKTFQQLSKRQKKQIRIRNAFYKNESLVVPPVMILSITNSCNLSCAGCYACRQDRNKDEELTMDEINRLTDEAVTLGVSVIMLAGGEPLVKQGILDFPKKYPDIIFVMFTNGLLIDDLVINQLKHTKNLIPVLSLEGDQTLTDTRRGKGVYQTVVERMNKLNHHRLLYGTSITLTSTNYEYIVHSDYLKQLETSGCRCAFLIEYVPGNSDETLCLTDKQKQDLRETTCLDSLNMLTVCLPGDEDKYGGCLAAGRGFIHISSTGHIEACPFAPYSDTNIKNMSLKRALQSDLLKKIRNQHHLLTESKGGCALNENKAWVKSLI